MYPTIETIREIAAKGQYKRVPVCREVYADRYTPVEVMRTLRTLIFSDILISLSWILQRIFPFPHRVTLYRFLKAIQD